MYACNHYADPFSELLFSSYEDALQYADVVEQLTGHRPEIREQDQ